MSKYDISRMDGTPWHVGCLKMDSMDSRRDKRSCVYFSENSCNIHHEKCIGSSHCSEYKVVENNKNKNASHKFQKCSSPKQHKMQLPLARIPDIIQQNDEVTVFCLQTNKYTTIVIPDVNIEKMAPIKALCYGKRLHDKISWNGYEFEITGLHKVI